MFFCAYSIQAFAETENGTHRRGVGAIPEIDYG
jgi:hypothetical protein